MKKIISHILLLQLFSYCFAQQPGKLTDKYFPDKEIYYETPAFNSSMGFTKYNELISFLENLTINNQYAEIEYFGETQRGKKIPLIIISKPGTFPKVKVWMQGGIHGNEPASSEGMLVVLQKLLKDDSYAHLLDRLDIAIVPMVNIDGYMRQNRLAKNGLDLNRDLIKLQIKETQQLKARYSQYAPHVSIDFHEYNPFRAAFRTLGSMGYTSYYDAMFLYSGDPNIDPAIRELTEGLFVSNAKQMLDEQGFRHHDYFSPKSDRGKLYFNFGSSSARSSATSFALANSISILMEIRGIRLNRNSFERRVLITESTAFSYLNTAYENYQQVLDGVNKAIKSTISMERDVVADSRRVFESKPLKFIDIGENEVVEKTYKVASTYEMEKLIVRKRPQAYILLPEQQEAIEKLKMLGLQIHTLEEDRKLQVEAYQVQKQLIEISKYQDYFPSEVSVKVVKKEKIFSKGTYVLPMNQKNANLAVTALEPENDNGFIRTRVVQVQKGQEVPIYRLMTTIPN